MACSNHSVTCEKEFGTWTVRLDGIHVADFWREVNARRIADRIAKALKARIE